MPNPNKADGTEWESKVVKDLTDIFGVADRHPQRGVAGEPDVWGCFPAPGSPGVYDTVEFVAWRRRIGKKSDGRRSSVKVAAMDYDEFMRLLSIAHGPTGAVSVQVQCKSTQSGSVTTWLTNLRKAVKQIWG